MILVSPTVEPVTLTQVKVQLGIQTTDTASDTALTQRITQARAWAEMYAKVSIMPQTHEIRLSAFPSAYIPPFPDKYIPLPFPPVVAVSSVKYMDFAGVLTTVASTDYELDTYQPIPYVRPAYGVSWPSARLESSSVRVQYTAGYPVVALESAKTITGITLATPGVVSITAHGYSDGDIVLLTVAGTTELTGLLYRVYAKATGTFQLANLTNDGAISTAAMTAFTSGTAQRVSVSVPKIMLEAMTLLIGHWTNFQSRIESGNFITRVPAAIEQMLDIEKAWGQA